MYLKQAVTDPKITIYSASIDFSPMFSSAALCWARRLTFDTCARLAAQMLWEGASNQNSQSWVVPFCSQEQTQTMRVPCQCTRSLDFSSHQITPEDNQWAQKFKMLNLCSEVMQRTVQITVNLAAESSAKVFALPQNCNAQHEQLKTSAVEACCLKQGKGQCWTFACRVALYPFPSCAKL